MFNMGNERHYDVILGIKWLKTLGDVMVNWKLLTMTFGSDTGKITLKGDPHRVWKRHPFVMKLGIGRRTEQSNMSQLEVRDHHLNLNVEPGLLNIVLWAYFSLLISYL
ncbi:hypothetical protein Tco_1320516 [Tanacetum coccineum]